MPMGGLRKLASFALMLCGSLLTAEADETFCSLAPGTYATAKTDYPHYAFALDELEKHGIAMWYADRGAESDYAAAVQDPVSSCDETSRLTVVVYGLPNKDCQAGYSSTDSTVKTDKDYALFIDGLTRIIGQRKVLYILEPDAVGLLVDGGCAVKYGYQNNLLVAVDKLTDTNKNAQVYVDVGFWNLVNSTLASKTAEIVKNLTKAGRGQVRGITLNTSNYMGTKRMAELCSSFQTAYNSTELNCIIDTSRNFNDTPSDEWCNRRTGAIGHPPTGETGIANVDYFVWIKPPGESDGECDYGHTTDAMVGPAAGQFFPEQFELLWNNGYLHKVDKLAGINLPPETAPPTKPTTTSRKMAIAAVLCGVGALAVAFVVCLVRGRRQNLRVKEINNSRPYSFL